MYEVVISEPEVIGCKARSWSVKLVESKRQDVAGRQLNKYIMDRRINEDPRVVSCVATHL